MEIDWSKRLGAIRNAMDEQEKDFDFFEMMPYTMLTRQELAFLYSLVANSYTNSGKIVDLGCFVGGSTYALASGLYKSGIMDSSKQIYSYDLFVWDKNQHDFLQNKLGFNIGDNFLEYYKQNIRQYLLSVEYFSGDFLQYPWDGNAIEICFIDISKHPTLNDFLVQNFFSSLMPGSIVIQQDFQFPGCFWLHITMEYFKEYFQLVGDLAYNSRIYMLIKQIPEERARQFSYDTLDYSRKLELLTRNLETVPNSPKSHAWLAGQLNLGLFYFWEGKKELSKACFDHAAETFEGKAWFYDMFFDVVKGWTGWSYERNQ